MSPLSKIFLIGCFIIGVVTNADPSVDNHRTTTTPAPNYGFRLSADGKSIQPVGARPRPPRSATHQPDQQHLTGEQIFDMLARSTNSHSDGMLMDDAYYLVCEQNPICASVAVGLVPTTTSIMY